MIYIDMDKTLMYIAIILIALSGFSIKTNKFKFEYLGLLDIIIILLNKWR